MTESTIAIATTDRPQLQFFAVLQGFVDLNDGDGGAEVSGAQIQEILALSLDNVVANGGITGDSPGQVDVYESNVRVSLAGQERSDESLLSRLDRLEVELAAAKQWRTSALEQTLRNEHVESQLISLVSSWRDGENLDVLMRNTEQRLQQQEPLWNGEANLIVLGADHELHCIGHYLSLRSLKTGASNEYPLDTMVAPWQAKSDSGQSIEVSFQEAYSLEDATSKNTGSENVAVTLNALVCDEIAFTGSELILTKTGIAPTRIPMVAGFFRFGGLVFLDMFASIQGAKGH